eukprot:gene5054-34845_t
MSLLRRDCVAKPTGATAFYSPPPASAEFSPNAIRALKKMYSRVAGAFTGCFKGTQAPAKGKPSQAASNTTSSTDLVVYRGNSEFKVNSDWSDMALTKVNSSGGGCTGCCMTCTCHVCEYGGCSYTKESSSSSIPSKRSSWGGSSSCIGKRCGKLNCDGTSCIRQEPRALYLGSNTNDKIISAATSRESAASDGTKGTSSAAKSSNGVELTEGRKSNYLEEAATTAVLMLGHKPTEETDASALLMLGGKPKEMAVAAPALLLKGDTPKKEEAATSALLMLGDKPTEEGSAASALLMLRNKPMEEVAVASTLVMLRNKPKEEVAAASTLLMLRNKPKEVAAASTLLMLRNKPTEEVAADSKLMMLSNEPTEEVAAASTLLMLCNKPTEVAAASTLLMLCNKPTEEGSAASTLLMLCNQPVEEVAAASALLMLRNKPTEEATAATALLLKGNTPKEEKAATSLLLLKGNTPKKEKAAATALLMMDAPPKEKKAATSLLLSKGNMPEEEEAATSPLLLGSSDTSDDVDSSGVDDIIAELELRALDIMTLVLKGCMPGGTKGMSSGDKSSSSVELTDCRKSDYLEAANEEEVAATALLLLGDTPKEEEEAATSLLLLGSSDSSDDMDSSEVDDIIAELELRAMDVMILVLKGYLPGGTKGISSGV